MRHNTVRLAAIIGASLLPLVAFAPAASAYGYAPSANEHEWASYARQGAPWAHEGYARDAYSSRQAGVVYLNGWSSSDNPHDCNKGCVNSN